MYSIGKDKRIDEQISALPAESLSSFAETMAFLEITRGQDSSVDLITPRANILSKVFGPEGRGLVVYLVMERDRRVELLEVLWL